ncbi:tyrosine-protein phosphatase [Lapillicoccus sp.]|uniref:tyrosine-protein phosphatase n=1 Tax=Lapillicoccus sp. TaxID=1909287 RepID=UPI0025D266EB|nr:tyrosine-protein phosphatase [Lapillicoccus sp.]
MSADPDTSPATTVKTSVPAWIDLPGVVNMRDVGGLLTEDGGVITPGRVLRSDNLQDLPTESVRRLVEDLGVTDVVDLRTFVEVAKEGDGPLIRRTDVHVQHFTLYPEDTDETGIPAGERELPWVGDPDLGDRARYAAAAAASPLTVGAAMDEEAAAEDGDTRPAAERGGETDPARHDSYWSNHYLGYLAQRPDSVVAALRAIADSPGAVIVHCAAGKDRTGTVIGLALKLAGATDEAIVADFLASAERVPQILERLKGRPAYAVNLDGKTVAQQSPRADTMRMMLRSLEEDHGGLGGWLGQHGWTADDTARLRAKLRD